MPFDRAWAKGHGYSDAEIDAYLHSPQGRADSVRAQSGSAPSENTMAGLRPPDQGFDPGLAQGALSLLPGAGALTLGTLGAAGGPAGIIGGAGLGAAGGEAVRQLGSRALGLPAPETAGDAAQGIGIQSALGGAEAMVPLAAGKVLTPAMDALKGTGAGKAMLRFAARRIPGFHLAEDVADLAGGLSGNGAEQAAEQVIPKGKTLVREHLRAVPKKAAPPKGSAAGRAKEMARRAKIRRGAPGPKPTATGSAESRVAAMKQRGATQEQLAKRGAMIDEIRAAREAQMQSEPDYTDLLQQSIDQIRARRGP